MSGSVTKHGEGEAPSASPFEPSEETNVERRGSATAESAFYERLARAAAQAKTAEAAQAKDQAGGVASAVLTRSRVE